MKSGLRFQTHIDMWITFSVRDHTFQTYTVPLTIELCELLSQRRQKNIKEKLFRNVRNFFLLFCLGVGYFILSKKVFIVISMDFFLYRCMRTLLYIHGLTIQFIEIYMFICVNQSSRYCLMKTELGRDWRQTV